MNAAEVRRLIGPHRILGVSTKNRADALRAQADGADYVGTGKYVRCIVLLYVCCS